MNGQTTGRPSTGRAVFGTTTVGMPRSTNGESGAVPLGIVVSTSVYGASPNPRTAIRAYCDAPSAVVEKYFPSSPVGLGRNPPVAWMSVSSAGLTARNRRVAPPPPPPPPRAPRPPPPAPSAARGEPDAFSSYARAFSGCFSRVGALDRPTRDCATSSKTPTRVSGLALGAADAIDGATTPTIATSQRDDDGAQERIGRVRRPVTARVVIDAYSFGPSPFGAPQTAMIITTPFARSIS